MTSQEIAPALLTRQQACGYLQVSLSTLKKLEAQGELHPLRMSDRVVRYTRTSLDHFIATLGADDDE